MLLPLEMSRWAHRNGGGKYWPSNPSDDIFPLLVYKLFKVWSFQPCWLQMSINVRDEERQETSQLTPMTKEELITGSLSNREISQGQKTVNEIFQISGTKSLFSIF